MSVQIINVYAYNLQPCACEWQFIASKEPQGVEQLTGYFGAEYSRKTGSVYDFRSTLHYVAKDRDTKGKARITPLSATQNITTCPGNDNAHVHQG